MPIPGTRRLERVEENAAATSVALSADEVADLNALAAGSACRATATTSTTCRWSSSDPRGSFDLRHKSLLPRMDGPAWPVVVRVVPVEVFRSAD